MKMPLQVVCDLTKKFKNYVCANFSSSLAKEQERGETLIPNEKRPPNKNVWGGGGGGGGAILAGGVWGYC
jgi:hypothetical protein